MAAEPRTVRVRAKGGEFRGLEWPEPGPLAVLVHAIRFCAEVRPPVWSAAHSAGADRVRAVAAEHTVMPAALLHRLRSSAPDVRVERVAGATHFAPLERPEALGALLGSFASALGEV